MVNFIVNNLIANKLTWEKVKTSKVYSPHIDAVLIELDNRGYKVEDNKLEKK